MGRIEKSVFISYRRDTGSAWVLAIAQNLTHHGFDVFFDYQGVASGDFEQIILENIRARAHFLVLLTPSALERIDEPGDWLRREIEAALNHRRNIVPIMLEGFGFSTPSIGKHLTGTIADLRNYNGLVVPAGYFDEAMKRLRTKYLNVAIEAVLHPPSVAAREAATAQRVVAAAAADVQTEELTAEQWFERGVEATDPAVKIRAYSEAIRLKPDYAKAYNNRSNARREKGGDWKGVLADYDEAIRLKPDAHIYYNRGIARFDGGDWDGALADCDEAIRLKPDLDAPYYNRGTTRRKKRDLEGARADLQKYLDLGGGVRDGNQGEVGYWIRELQDELKAGTKT